LILIVKVDQIGFLDVASNFAFEGGALTMSPEFNKAKRWAPDKLRRSDVVTNLIREMDTAGKPVAIICHGGLVAISAGIVRGRQATGSLGIKDDLINAGAQWVDRPAFREGNLVWGRVVADIPAFCRELIAALSEAAGT
jgi:protease I